MKRRIQTIEERQKREALDFVEKVFTEYQDETEGRVVRALVEEIRGKKFYIPNWNWLRWMSQEQSSGM